MANEVTVNATLAYSDSDGSRDSLQITDFLQTVAAKKFLHAKQSIGTSEEAIVLGEVTGPDYGIFINRDPTNFIELRVGTGGAKFAKLRPGRAALVPLGSGAQAPYAVADTAACVLEYFIVNL